MNSLIYALLMAFSTLILESCTKTSAKAGAQESVEWAGHRFQEVATLRGYPVIFKLCWALEDPAWTESPTEARNTMLRTSWTPNYR